jgi:hypothetical protein
MAKGISYFCTGCVAALFFLEALFRALPVSTATYTGYHIHPDILTYPQNHCFTAATGWDLKNARQNCANNDGFVASRDFVFDREAIALIGDSFVEASMLSPHERLANRIEARLDKPVYALGGPGSNLLDYAERALFAAKRYGLRNFVFVLERGDIKQALCGSGNVHGPCIDPTTLEARLERQSGPGLLKRVARESALAQYVFSQLRPDFGKLFSRASQKHPPGHNANPAALTPEEESRVLSAFLAKMASVEGRLLFLIDADRKHLETASGIADSPEFRCLNTAIALLGGRVIDPTEVFRAHARQTGRILEVGPYDGHWNGEATGLLATLIADALDADRRAGRPGQGEDRGKQRPIRETNGCKTKS